MTPEQDMENNAVLAERMTDQQMADALAAKGWTVRPAPTRPQVMEQMTTVASHYARCLAEKIEALIPYVDDDTEASDWARVKVTEIYDAARPALKRLEAALRARDARKTKGRKAA